MATLTPAQILFFQEQGYVLPHQQLFTPEKFAELQAIFEEQLAQKGEKRSDELDTPHFRDERLLAFLLSNEVLDLVEPLIGPNIALWSSHFICKDPFIGRATPWHEDSAFWKGRCSSYEKIVTVWLALDQSTQENGCMQVIPGTHLAGGFSEYVEVNPTQHTFSEQIKGLDPSRTVAFELQPGEYSLHDGRIIHGAHANTSPFRRCGYTMRYLSTAIRIYPEKNQGHRIWLARGQDLAGNSYEIM